MTIIMTVSYISCPFLAKAEALLPCACTEASLPLKRPGEEGSARSSCRLLEFTTARLKSGRFLAFAKI